MNIVYKQRECVLVYNAVKQFERQREGLQRDIRVPEVDTSTKNKIYGTTTMRRGCEGDSTQRMDG